MKKLSVGVLLVVILVFGVASLALADGTETLGPPSISIASGTGIVAAGTGLHDAQPDVISFNVPGDVEQVLLYWAGAVTSNALSDDTILVNGVPVVGQPIGGQAFFFNAFGKDFYYSNYSADISGLGLVGTGANSLTVEGLENKDDDGNGENSGAGVLVIFDDGSTTSDIEIKDGLDLAFAGFPDPRNTTVPQTFTFTPDVVDRVADLSIFAGSVGVEGDRTNTIVLTSDVGDPADVVDALASVDGNLWDTLTLPVTIPAGATELTVQLLSGSVNAGNPASLNWIGAGLSVPPPPPPGFDGCSPGFWRNHFESWPPTGLDPSDDFDTTFGVDYFDPDITLGEAIWLGGGGVKKIARHGTAALLNALHPAVDYPVSAAEVIAAVQAKDVGALADYNELSDTCPAKSYSP